MTIVAWDGKTLAADKRATCGGLIRTTTKIHRVDGALIGAAGNTALIREMIAWYKAGAKPSDFPSSLRDKDEWPGLLVIERDRILRYEQTPWPIEFEDQLFAIGSGRDFALAAMHLGKSAREAVEVACHFDCSCGNGIDTLELDE